MRVSCILRSGLLLVTLSLAIVKNKQPPFAKTCYPKGTLSRAVDFLRTKTPSFKETIPKDRIKKIRLLKKKTKKLFMKNCRFQDQLLSFFMEDVFGKLPKDSKEINFVEEFYTLRQKFSHCFSCTLSTREMKPITRMKRKFYEIGQKGIYKAISELDILLSWIKNFLESVNY